MTTLRETPRPRRPWLARVRDADPFTGDDIRRRVAAWRVFDPERRGWVAHVDAGPGRIEPERRGHETGSGGEAVRRQALDPVCRRSGSVWRESAPTSGRAHDPVQAHRLEPREGLDGTDEDGAGHAARLRPHL